MNSTEDRLQPTRRGFVALLAQAMAAVTLWPRLRWSRRPRAESPLEQALLETLDALPMRTSSARLGVAYLRHHPDEADPAGLLATLARRIDPNSEDDVQEDVGPRLLETFREDFEHGRTAIVDGWLLSVTEARALALISQV